MSDNNSSKTNVLHLENLTKKYDTLLIQLNQAQLDYADYLNNQSNHPVLYIDYYLINLYLVHLYFHHIF